MADHQHRWHEEQQTGHRFCDACGKHDPPDPTCKDRPSGLWNMLSGMDLNKVILGVNGIVRAEHTGQMDGRDVRVIDDIELTSVGVRYREA